MRPNDAVITINPMPNTDSTDWDQAFDITQLYQIQKQIQHYINRNYKLKNNIQSCKACASFIQGEIRIQWLRKGHNSKAILYFRLNQLLDSLKSFKTTTATAVASSTSSSSSPTSNSSPRQVSTTFYNICAENHKLPSKGYMRSDIGQLRIRNGRIFVEKYTTATTGIFVPNMKMIK